MIRDDVQQAMEINPLIAEIFQQHGVDQHSNGLYEYVNTLEDAVMRLHNVLFVQVAEMQAEHTFLDIKHLNIELEQE